MDKGRVEVAGWTFDRLDTGEVIARNKKLCDEYIHMNQLDLLGISDRWRRMAQEFTEASKRAGHYHGDIVFDGEVQRVTKLLETAISSRGIQGVDRLGRCIRRPDDDHLHWALAKLDELDAMLRAEATTSVSYSSPITSETVIELLHKKERSLLDVKLSHYSFENENSKAKLVKDLLAFANLNRSQDAHILVGVKESRDGPHEIVGLNEAERVDGARFHDLLSKLTNRNLAFDYEEICVNGRWVGIFTIPHAQKRPLCLLKNYGNLHAGVVYVRYGSSTRVAMPDEST